MNAEPQLQARPEQHCAVIARAVPMDGIAAAVDDAFPALFGWLAASGQAPAGPPFIRYLVTAMAADLQLEFGVPVSAPVAGRGRVRPGVLPAGRYAVLRHTGPYDGLMTANAAVQDWAQRRGIALDTWDTPAGPAWGCRAEHYLTDPSREPDPAKWETDVAYLTRED